MKAFYYKVLVAFAIGLTSMLMLALLSSPLQAQTSYGSVVGTVTDASGAVIPGALVTLTNIGTNQRNTAPTDEAGNYRYVNLVPANYRLEVEMAGFKRLTREAIIVQVQSTVRADVKLEVGAISETVEVTSVAPLLQTETGTLGAVVEGQRVQQMPINGRNILNLIGLTAGVTPQGSAMGQASLNQSDHTNPDGFGNFQIGGGIANTNAMYVDGAPVNVLKQNKTTLIVTQDAVQEFNVATNSTSAEYGRTGGGVVNMATKSGTNAFHGSVYEYFRNTVLNANKWESNMAGKVRPKMNQNQYGAYLSGPIVKDEAFFFFSWEGFNSRFGYPVFGFVPSDDLRSGIFTTKITDPRSSSSTCVTQVGSTYRLNMDANSGCVSPTARWFVNNYWPRANVSLPNANFYHLPTIGDNHHQYNGRVDYNISDKQRLFGRFTYWNMEGLPLDMMNNPLTANSSSNVRTHQLVLGDTYTFSHTTILDVRASYFRSYFDDNPPSLNMDLSKIGSNWGKFQTLETFVLLPGITVPSSSNIMTSRGTNLNFNRTNNYDLNASLIKMMGKHNLKAGAEFRLMDCNWGGGGGAGGRLTLGSNVTDTITGYWWASFLMGIPASMSISSSIPITDFNYYQGYYVSDAWQVNKKLTLNFGLRWELPGAVAEKKDRNTVLLPFTYDPLIKVTGTMVLVNSSLYPDRHMVEVKYGGVSPRVGLAYRLTNNTVLRIGYGLSFLPPDMASNLSASSSPVNAASRSWSNSGTGPFPYSLDNPFPTGIPPSPGRSIGDNFVLNYYNPATYTGSLATLQSFAGIYPYQSYANVQQWNLAIGRQFAGSTMVEIGYAGSKGTHLPISLNLNEVNQQNWAQVVAVSDTNKRNQLAQSLKPWPFVNNVTSQAVFAGDSTYNSLQTKLEKRFKSGGVLSANYTWAKLIADSESGMSWMEDKPGAGGGGQGGGFQDYLNLDGEKSLSTHDVSHRATVSYVLDLPFGNGKNLANWGGVAGALVSGWTVNGITIFQKGFPIAIGASQNSMQVNQYLGIPTTVHANVVSGCDAVLSGSAQSNSKWFNTACFQGMSGTNLIGNASRTDPKLRAPGINNFDLSLLKTTRVKEQVNVQFRAEFFNIFNHVRFNFPDSNVNSATFGQTWAQANQPRAIQFSLRLNF